MAARKIRLPDETAERLDELADRLDRPVDQLVQLAIEDYLARQLWQLAEIEAGLADARDGDFATNDEVLTVLAKFTANAAAE